MRSGLMGTGVASPTVMVWIVLRAEATPCRGAGSRLRRCARSQSRPRIKTAVARLGVERQARAGCTGCSCRRASARISATRPSLRRLVAYLLAPDTACVDVGAHRGDLLADIVRVAPDGRHRPTSRSPSSRPSSAPPSRRSTSARPRCRTARRSGSSSGSWTTLDGAASASGLRPARDGRSASASRRSAWTTRCPPGIRPGFVKINIEGAEREVLAGALGTLREHRPVVAFEHGLGSADYYGTGPDDVWDLLCEQAALRISKSTVAGR